MKILRRQMRKEGLAGWSEITREEAAKFLRPEQMLTLEHSFNPVQTAWGTIYRSCNDELAEYLMGFLGVKS